MTGKFGECYIILANEPFERYWRILIRRLRRGYYSIDVAVHRKTLIWRSTVQIAKLKLPPKFSVIR